MKKLLLFFAVLSSFVCTTSCNSNDKTSPQQQEVTATPIVEEMVSPAPVQQVAAPDSYTLISSEPSSMNVNGITVEKMSYIVEIPSEYSNYQLENIARYLAQEVPQSNNVFVEFYLPTQPKNGINYGISKRLNGSFETQINYIAPPKEEPKVVTPYDGASKIYGKWAMQGATVIVYQKNGRCYMVNHYGGSNYGDPEVYHKTTFRGKTAFKNAEDPSDMYVIESDGSLGGYFEGDLCITLGRIE